MSFDLPAGVERDIQRYAQAENISTDEAVIKLVKSGLLAVGKKAIQNSVKSGDLVRPVVLTTVQQQLKQVESLGETTGLDSPKERREKLEALFALSDAAIAEGMETWTTERILEEVSERRGTNKPNLY